MNTIDNLCEFFKINLTQLSELTNIPYRSLQNWKKNYRKAPVYMIDLLVVYVCEKYSMGLPTGATKAAFMCFELDRLEESLYLSDVEKNIIIFNKHYFK